MTVMTSWPGIYIQELPSLAHSVQPAPTSIAVFIGYTHPFLTNQPYTAIQLNSPADYQASFGGFFSCPWQPDYVGQAVSQFFLNGGSVCYVVGLPAKEYYDGTLTAQGETFPAAVEIPAGGATEFFAFTAKQPVGTSATFGLTMQVAISNLQPTAAPTSMDVVISYGSTVESYRAVTLATVQARLANSNLVMVAPSAAAPTALPAAQIYSLDYSNPPAGAIAPAAGLSVINPTDFGQVFEQYGSLDKVPIFNLLATPGITDPAVTAQAVAFCEGKRAFYIMDTPSATKPDGTASAWAANAVVASLTSTTPPVTPDPQPQVSINAAVYYPWLRTTDPLTGLPMLSPPSGYVAGMYGQTDNTLGVWQSPAGIQTTLKGTTGVDQHGIMTDPQQGTFNANAIDCLRQMAGAGTVVFGARTTAGATLNSAQQQWRYVAVRRTTLFIEQSLYSSLTWAVFRPNATPLWNALTQEVNAFMLSLFRQGAFAGDTPSQAFVVQCDSTTTTQNDIQNGIVNIIVGFAPLVPAEFVIIKIAQLAGQGQS